jgi:uncharacterized protein YndB with AHSA1/START domain
MISDGWGGADGGRALIPGSLRGYRTWRLLKRRASLPEGALPLTSVTRPVVWAPTLEARCCFPPATDQHPAVPSTSSLASHRSPSRGCECGIYAWYAPSDTQVLHAGVFGAVEACGLVLMGDRGYRAERARISAVVTRNRRLAAACAAAGVTVYGRRHDLLRDYPPDDLSGLLGANSTPEPEVHDKGGTMAAIVDSIEISRRPEDIFSYVTDPSHFPEWQESVVSVSPEGHARLTVGSKTTVVRRVGPRKMVTTEEIVELHTPTTWSVRSVGGPLVAIATGTIQPLDGGQRSRVTVAFEFEAHGIGRLLVPLVVRPQVRRQLPRNEQRLKDLLERQVSADASHG